MREGRGAGRRGEGRGLRAFAAAWILALAQTPSLVRDIRPGPEGAAAAGLIAAGETLFFSADDGTRGPELRSSDGTEAGTLPLGEIEPGAFSSNPEGFTRQGTQLFFAAESEAPGRELHLIGWAE